MVHNRNFWGSSPFLDLFLFFLANQSGARARAEARAHQLFIDISHVREITR